MYFEEKKSFRIHRLGFCAPLVENCIFNPEAAQQESVMTVLRAQQHSSYSCFVLSGSFQVSVIHSFSLSHSAVDASLY